MRPNGPHIRLGRFRLEKNLLFLAGNGGFFFGHPFAIIFNIPTVLSQLPNFLSNAWMDFSAQRKDDLSAMSPRSRRGIPHFPHTRLWLNAHNEVEGMF